MNGLRLEQLDASDMLDVLHFFFEESINFSTAEQAKSVDSIRTKIYSDMYNKTYKYGSGTGSGFNTNSASDFDFEEENPEPVQEEVNPFNPRHKVPAKAFVPATDFSEDDDNPFGKLLDAPAG